MKIVVVTGSPHKHGTSALLADEFICGAEESGHEIYRFDAAFHNVHPCVGCEKCGCGKYSCVVKDDMVELASKLKEADFIVFVSPVYYHDVSAQMKMVIDRFHGIEIELQNSPKNTMLIMTAASKNKDVVTGALAVHQRTLQHLNWYDNGYLLALGCNTLEDMKKTLYPKQAYKMGRSIK